MAQINFPHYDLPSVILVTGGCGFLGRTIIEALVGQKDVKKIIAFDIATRKFNDPRVEVVQGDLLNPDSLISTLQKHGVEAIIHTASPHAKIRNKELLFNVNVKGTQAIIDACLQLNIKTLVHTSSASVIWQGVDQDGITEEEAPYPTTFRDTYAETKTLAEQLIVSAGKTHSDKLVAIALRPHAIFGPGDVQFLPELLKAAKAGKDKVLIGNGNNLVDWTYVGNVVHSHLLAVQAGHKHWKGDVSKPCPASGKAYFITNGEPVPFWAFMNAYFLGFGFDGSKYRLPATPIIALATVAQFFVDILNKFRPANKQIELTLDPSRLKIVSYVHYYSIENARRDLGYTPLWDLSEAIFITLWHNILGHRHNRPSEYAVQRAKECNMDVLGFVRDPDYRCPFLDVPESELPVYTREEVAKHNHTYDLWCIVDGKVYDLTFFYREHQGGAQILLNKGGQDASEGFHGPQHPETVMRTLEQYLIGRLAD